MISPSYRLIFFGHNRYSLVALKLLLAAGLKPVAVVTLADRPQGRDQKTVPGPVAAFTTEKKIPRLIFSQLKNDLSLLKKYRPQIGFLASFGAIIPEEVFQAFPKGIIVLHPSLLPQYRGASPVRATLIDNQTPGVSLFQMDQLCDHGPILAQASFPAGLALSLENLTTRLFEIGTRLFLNQLPLYLNGQISPHSQDETKATFCPKFTHQTAQINWAWPPEKIERFIRAMHPDPGAWTPVRIKDQIKILKILAAETNRQKLLLKTVQLEGKKPVSWAQFKAGHPGVKIT